MPNDQEDQPTFRDHWDGSTQTLTEGREGALAAIKACIERSRQGRGDHTSARLSAEYQNPVFEEAEEEGEHRHAGSVYRVWARQEEEEFTITYWGGASGETTVGVDERHEEYFPEPFMHNKYGNLHERYDGSLADRLL